MTRLNRLWTSYTKARTRSVLAQLSDRQLDDIGIRRAGIDAHVATLF